MQKETLIVDGYNFICASEKYKKMYEKSSEHARYKIVELLSDYTGYTKKTIIVVFDAYKTNRDKRTIETFSDISVVFTKKGETADAFIEAFVTSELEDTRNVTVVTEDRLIAVLATGNGCKHRTSSIMHEDIKAISRRHQIKVKDRDFSRGNSLESFLDEKTRKILEEKRRD